MAAMPSFTDRPFGCPPDAGPVTIQPFGTAYKLTNKVTGAAYVGVTRENPLVRLRHHRAASKREDTVLYRAARKYGWDQFDLTVLAGAKDPQSLMLLEQMLIAEHKTHVRDGGYNMTGGGEGTPDICDETRAKMRLAARKRLTPETRAKISASLKGRPLPDHVRSARIALQTGKPLSDDHKRALSMVARGRIITAEQRVKISAGLKAYFRRKVGNDVP